MIRVGVSGAAGRMGRVVAAAAAGASDLELGGLFAPGHGGEVIEAVAVGDIATALSACDVVVEVTRPDVVMENLAEWRRMGLHAVVGTSGFDARRLAELERLWGEGPPNCIVSPNFSVGAALMMRFAEAAAPFFPASEVIELHHDRKADAPSGTAISTAERMSAAGGEQRRSIESAESAGGARGGRIGGVPVHSVRLPGLLAHQEVLLGGPGEVLTIRHDSTSRESFVPGILLAIRRVADLSGPVTVGLDPLLDA